MKKLIIAFIILSTSAAFASELDNTKWMLENNSQSELSFKEGKFQLYIGCNRIGGAYTVQNKKLSFKDVYSTKMFCQHASSNESVITGTSFDLKGNKLESKQFTWIKK